MAKKRRALDIARISIVALLILDGVRAFAPNGESSSSAESEEESRSRREEKSKSEVLDDLGRLVEEAYENGELLDRSHFYPGATKITVQRDTSRYRDTRTFVSLKPMSGAVPGQGQMRVAPHRPTPTRSNEEQRMQSDGQIVFPDDRMDRPGKPIAAPAPVCEGSNFCEHAPYYPKDLVDAALQRNETLKLFASVDVDIGERIDTMDDISLCQSKVEVVYPVSAKKDDNEWVFVVNQDNFKQGVRVETCRNTSAPCSLVENTPAGYRMTCKQQYISRQLMSVDQGQLATRYFQFPASCCCHAKFVGNAHARIGEESLDSTTERKY